MKRSTLKAMIVILAILDVIVLALAFGPFLPEAEETMAVQTTLPTETTLPQTEPPQTLPAETEPTETELTEERFTLTFAGDCTFGADVGIYYAPLGFVKTVGDDIGYPFRNILTYFEEDDFTMVNLEGVLAERGSPVPKAFNFLGPTHFVDILTEGSVEAVTVANNHTLDYGPNGYASTLETLEQAGVPYVERDSTCVVTTESGLTIGLYGMVYHDLDVEAMKEGIDALEEQGVDLIIVAPHWGVEGTYLPTQEQIDVGRAAIDAGADIVYGTHPHVLQPIEKYKEGILYYSLGNFSFGGNGAPEDMDSAMIRQEVIRYSDGTVKLGETTPIPVCISSISDYNNYQPTPYEPDSEAYDRTLAKLRGTWE